MLMAERLIDTHIIVTPTEVGSCTRLYSCTRTTGNGIHHHIIVQQQILGQWQQAQLNASSKATGIGYMLAMADSAAIQFRQSVYKVMVIALDSVIHAKVNNLQVFRQRMTLHELLGIAMSGTEEQDIDFIHGKFVCKDQFGFTIQSFVYICYFVSSVTATIDESNFHFRMVDEQAKQFAGGISCTANNPYFYHYLLNLFGSSGMKIVNIKYSKAPGITAKKRPSNTHMTRTNMTLTPKCFATPAHIPANILPVRGRVSFFSSTINQMFSFSSLWLA
jgi:hypothetical protein